MAFELGAPAPFHRRKFTSFRLCMWEWARRINMKQCLRAEVDFGIPCFRSAAIIASPPPSSSSPQVASICSPFNDSINNAHRVSRVVVDCVWLTKILSVSLSALFCLS